MSIYHCSIKIINRASGRSAVASAAYRSGERLHNEETGLTHDFTAKGGVIMNEIMLPENAPEKYSDREILWNEVQQIEKRSDAQFAREVEVALPREMTREEQIECVRSYIKANFVDKGMIADWALHDNKDGNPHAHIMLTVRGFDEKQDWTQKQKTVFANARDKSGRAIFNPGLPCYNPKDREKTSKYRIPQLDEEGKQKTRTRASKGTEYLWEKITIPENDWNDRKNAEVWRASWASHCNRYLEPEQQIEHRSYERLGIELEPTKHEGLTARKMEAYGKIADRCQLNREIKELNTFRKKMKELAKDITDLIVEKARGIYERFKEFGRGLGDFEGTRRDVGDFGRAASSNRGFNQGESEPAGAVGRISEYQRSADSTAKETKITDRKIDKADGIIAIASKRITGLRKLKERKEKEINDRFEELKQRWSGNGSGSKNDGKARRSYKESRDGDIRTTEIDIESLLRELDTKERGSREDRDNSIAKRADRESERKRPRARAEQGIDKAERRTQVERGKGERRREGPSLRR